MERGGLQRGPVVHAMNRILQFDGFSLDLARGRLRQGEQDITLRPKTCAVLRCLADNAGRLVPKHEIIEAVWPKHAVSDDSLVQCIRELRGALGSRGYRLIKTAFRRGYMLDATVTAHAAPYGAVGGNGLVAIRPFSLVVLPFRSF